MKTTIISKAFVEKYWDNYIEKAMSHKYIRKIPNSKGGYYYIYPKDFAKPMKVLLSIFGMKEEKIDDSYKNNNIQEVYGVNKQGYAAHLLEYLSNKGAWNKFFGDKFNRDRYKTPIKTESKKTTEKTNVKESEIKNNGKTTDKTNKEHNETKEKDFKSKWNNSLMRKIYSMYNPIPEDKVTDTKQNQESGDKVSFNGNVGTITKDYGNGMVFVKFDNGGMGRFKKTDLQNLAPSNQEVANEADAKGDEIKENDSTLNTSNDTVAEVTTNYENKEPLKEKTQEEKDKEWHEKWDVRLADEFVKGKEKYLNAKPLVSTNAFILFNNIWDQIKDKTKNEQIKWLYNQVKDDYQMSWNESLAYRKEGYSKEEVRFGYINAFLETKNPAEEHENRSQAMMGNQNAKKYGSMLDAMISDKSSKLDEIRNSTMYSDKQKKALLRDTYNELIKPITDIAIMNSADKNAAISEMEGIINTLISRLPDNEKELINTNMNYERLIDLRSLSVEYNSFNRSNAMLGNQNARKYGNLSEEANQIIENNNLPVNANGVVQPTETELKTSKEFFEKNRNQNYKFGKDQYGNYYIQMPGVDGYYYDEKGNRVDNAAMIHQRTYHDEYIPEEPNFVTNNMNGERIYLTEEMKQIMNSGDTEYHPVDSSYVKPESDSFIDDYIDTLSKEKDINSLKARKHAMKHIYEMGKDKGIYIIPVSGIMSNSGMVTNAILPIGESDPMSDNSILIKKNDKALIDFANHVIDTVEPANTPKGQNVLLSNPEKNVLSLAYEFEKRQNPTMSNLWYIEKVKEKLPELAAKVDNWEEIENINFGSKMFKDADAVQEIKDYVEEQKKEESNTNSALENYASGDGMWVNNYLRNPSLYESESGVLNETDKQFIADLDNATTTETITDKKLYRAVDASAVFGNISDLDFENLQASVVYGNKEKLYADKVDSLINGAMNKEITEKGFMSTTKDEEIAANWDGFTGSNKEVVMELNIPDGLTGKDMKDFDVEGDEQKEVLLPRNLDYKVTEITKGKNGKILVKADVLGVHGNHIAMLGNQNARKNGLTEDEQKQYQKEYDWYKETYVDGIREQNPYTNEEETIADILKDEADERYTVYGENDLGYKALKDLYTDTTGKEYTPTKKKMPKPQTESEMKKEQKKEKEARKKAGLPNPGNNVGDRVSAIDDADTWNPNSENYRFKDTGYIAGSRKELASMFIMERAKRGERIDAHELDFDGLEENPRAAEKLITKSNIFGEVDWDGLREKGMSGSAAFLIDRIYASAGSKPDESNAQARKQYVIALNGLRDRFEDCKTVPEVIDTLKEIREEIRGEYVEIKEMPEYKKITARMKELNTIMRNKRDELMSLSDQGSKTYEVEKQKIVEKYIQKGKDEKLLRWNTRVSVYNIPKQYQEEFKKETKGLWDKAYGPWKKAVADFKAELLSRGVKEEDFFTDKKNMAGKPIEVSWYDYYTLMPEAQEYGALDSELDAYIKKMKVAVSMKNPLLEAWKSLGKRFTDILYSDSFNQHKYDCTKGTYDNWEWLEKEVKVTEKKTGKEKKKFQLLVANEITRKGGRDFNVTSTEDLKKSFNLRDVQSGNWVLKDPASAEFHVRNAAQAFADLADVTGISDDKISLNGRLAMAFGARGTGGFNGTAAAHYEPVERVINLTKFHGGGSLGHEWFHAFDNMITSAMTGDDSISNTYLTNVYHGLSETNQLLLREYIELQDADATYSNVYRRGQLARQLEKKGVDLKKIKGEKTALQFKIQTAFDDLVKAMTIGNSDMKMNLTYEGKDYKDMLRNMSDDSLKFYRDRYSVYSGDRKPMQLLIADAGSLDGAVAKINERYENYKDAKSQKNKMEWLKIAAAYYDRQPDGNKNGIPLRVSSGRKVSQFLSDANDLDMNSGKNYWSTTHEMAARAFSAYLYDTLNDMGRQNDYLAYATENKYYEDNPYPEGEERKRINAAFKKLFEVVNEQKAIQKAIDILDKFVIEKSEPRFIIKGGRFLVRK